MAINADTKQSASVGATKLAGRTVLTPEGAISLNSCTTLQARLDAALSQNKSEVILDCKKVTYFDSAALSLLLLYHEKMREAGGTLKLTTLNEVCRDILVATRLINTLFVFEDVHKAVTCRL